MLTRFSVDFNVTSPTQCAAWLIVNYHVVSTGTIYPAIIWALNMDLCHLHD